MEAATATAASTATSAATGALSRAPPIYIWSRVGACKLSSGEPLPVIVWRDFKHPWPRALVAHSLWDRFKNCEAWSSLRVLASTYGRIFTRPRLPARKGFEGV
jgi:hypothetical protein